jgi:hypothetical protein
MSHQEASCSSHQGNSREIGTCIISIWKQELRAKSVRVCIHYPHVSGEEGRSL